jgi:hypothetical protein
MGTSSSPAQLADKIRRAGIALERSQPEATKRAAQAAKDRMLVEVRRAAPNLVLRGVGKKGAKLGVRYTVLNTTAIVRATGPLHLVERDTKPHVIGPKSRKGKRRGAVRLPDGQFRGVIHHPGTKGKHPWAKGAEAARPIVADEMSKTAIRAVTEVFR